MSAADEARASHILLYSDVVSPSASVKLRSNFIPILVATFDEATFDFFIYENTLQKGVFAKIKSRTAPPLFVKSIRIVPHYIAVGKHRIKDVKIAIS